MLLRLLALWWARPRVGDAAADRFARTVAALGTLGLIIASASYLVSNAVNLPIGDEWHVVLELVGQPFSFTFVTAPHNDHRYMLGRLIWGLGLRGTGYDFRTGGWLTLIVLSASAAAGMRVLRRLREHSLADLFIPVLLLNAGHSFNLLMGYQVVFAVVAACGVGLLAVAARAEPGRELRTGRAAGLGLLLMMLNGGFGLGFAPAIGCWLAYLAWRSRLGPNGGRIADALRLLAFPALAAVYVIWCLESVPRTSTAVAPSIGTLGERVAEYLLIGLGPWVADPVRISASLRSGLEVGMVLFYLAIGARLLGVIWRHPEERPRAVGILSMWCGQWCVAVGIGLNRDGALAERFTTPSTVGLLACAAALARYGPRIPIGAVLMVALAGELVAVNVKVGRQEKWMMAGPLRECAKDLAAGASPTMLAGRYTGTYALVASGGRSLAPQIEILRINRIGPFRRAACDPPMANRLVEGLAMPVTFACDDAPFHPGGPPPTTIRVPAPGRPVKALWLGIRQYHNTGWQVAVLRWREAETGVEHSSRSYLPGLSCWGECGFWIDGNPTDLRLEAASPIPGLEIERADWLLPAE